MVLFINGHSGHAGFHKRNHFAKARARHTVGYTHCTSFIHTMYEASLVALHMAVVKESLINYKVDRL